MAHCLGFKVYSPPSLDRIWLWVYLNKIPIYPKFYLLKRDYRIHGGRGCAGSHAQGLETFVLSHRFLKHHHMDAKGPPWYSWDLKPKNLGPWTIRVNLNPKDDDMSSSSGTAKPILLFRSTAARLRFLGFNCISVQSC